MDEFGVLVQSIGFKGQRNSTPLADLKNKRNINPQTNSFFNDNSNNFKPTGKSFGDFGDGFGEFKSNETRSGVDGFDLDSVFNVSGGNKSIYADDDIFGGLPAQQSAPADDFFTGFGGFGTGSNGSVRKSDEAKMGSRGFDDLIPGFGGKKSVRNGENTGKIRPPPPAGDSVKPVFSSAGDPFLVLEQPSSQDFTSGNNSKPKPQDASKRSTFSSVDDFDVFDMGGQMNNSNHQSDPFQNDNAANHFDSIFNIGPQSANISRTKSTSVDPVLDSLFGNKKSTSMEERGPTVGKTPGTSTSMKEATSRKNSVDDFLFFGEPTSSSDVFQEVKGESEERRKARLNQHMRTQERMAKALAEKNQRDFRTQQEQEEKHRVAETMNDNIKRWAAGKEGNLRALLSSLQHVLWPECGWQPVSLTDLITSVSVKKVYFKATLCVHPDKVQQKGAGVQQKYIAEKVFDLLKEAWNKFNAEELR